MVLGFRGFRVVKNNEDREKAAEFGNEEIPDNFGESSFCVVVRS